MPIPLSRISILSSPPAPDSARTSTRPPCGVNLTALPMRLSSTWRSRVSSPVMTCGAARDVDTERDAARFGARGKEPHRILDQHRQVDLRLAQREPAGFGAGEIEDIVDQHQQVTAAGENVAGIGLVSRHADRAQAARR